VRTQRSKRDWCCRRRRATESESISKLKASVNNNARAMPSHREYYHLSIKRIVQFASLGIHIFGPQSISTAWRATFLPSIMVYLDAQTGTPFEGSHCIPQRRHHSSEPRGYESVDNMNVNGVASALVSLPMCKHEYAVYVFSITLPLFHRAWLSCCLPL
jgi:hypothetical protein